MVVFTETDTEDDQGSAGLIFWTISRRRDSHSHKQHMRLRTENNGENTRGCPSVLICIVMTPEEEEDMAKNKCDLIWLLLLC